MKDPQTGPDPIRLHIAAERLPRDGLEIRYEANAAERAALARHLEIVEVSELRADLTASRWRGEGVRVKGRLRAVVVQESVVTLDPLRQSIDEPFETSFVPEGSRLAPVLQTGENEIHVDPEGEDPPETFRGPQIDVGPFLVEALSLALDPYPRESGASFEAIDTDPDPKAGVRSAFDVLTNLVPANRKDGEGT
ncbi:DUF177 domain-containing protein [Aurantimonas sp. A2-1-M11]|uniref:YceD family protein n=1 Tax=Aurantimonas sp. A2-1-M11 TaxID=3113712 RepID=UPI002F930DD7